MQVPISGSRSYNELALHTFNATAHRAFHCLAAGSSSVLLLHHDAVNHILHIEERLRDGMLREEAQIKIRRVLHGSLLPTNRVWSFVPSLQKGPDSVIWINLSTTKRFSVDESFYYVPAELPGNLASVQRVTGFYKDGDCLGESANHNTRNVVLFCPTKLNVLWHFCLLKLRGVCLKRLEFLCKTFFRISCTSLSVPSSMPLCEWCNT